MVQTTSGMPSRVLLLLLLLAIDEEGVLLPIKMAMDCVVVVLVVEFDGASVMMEE